MLQLSPMDPNKFKILGGSAFFFFFPALPLSTLPCESWQVVDLDSNYFPHLSPKSPSAPLFMTCIALHWTSRNNQRIFLWNQSTLKACLLIPLLSRLKEEGFPWISIVTVSCQVGQSWICKTSHMSDCPTCPYLVCERYTLTLRISSLLESGSQLCKSMGTHPLCKATIQAISENNPWEEHLHFESFDSSSNWHLV